MLTEGFYTHLASLVKREGQENRSFYMALGTGEADWDVSLPHYHQNVSKLQRELVRKEVRPKDIHFLNEKGEICEQATPAILIEGIFSEGEGIGTVRECGLFGGDAGASANSGTLLSYFMHPAIEKSANMSLRRSMRLDLKPKPLGEGQVVTRYLGNSKSQEFHDTEHATPQCQLDEIRFDRHFYFISADQAVSMGYDYCAFCFGKDLSQR